MIPARFRYGGMTILLSTLVISFWVFALVVSITRASARGRPSRCGRGGCTRIQANGN
jgi:hypothetical protein